MRNIFKTRKPRVYAYGIKPRLMTHAEVKLYYRIRALLNDYYHVFPQVHLSAILEHKIENGQSWDGAFSHINGKSVDFVICDKELKPVVAIELVDWSHELEHRKNRDAEVKRIFDECNLPLVWIDDANEMSDAELQATLREAAALPPPTF